MKVIDSELGLVFSHIENMTNTGNGKITLFKKGYVVASIPASRAIIVFSENEITTYNLRNDAICPAAGRGLSSSEEAENICRGCKEECIHAAI